MADDNEQKPWERNYGTATATDDEEDVPWKKNYGAAPPPAPATPSETDLPGSTPRLRATAKSFKAPLPEEAEHPPIPTWYGLTPGNVLGNVYEAGKGILGSTAQGLYDLTLGEGKDKTGEERHGLGGLVGMNAEGKFDPAGRVDWLAQKYITDPYKQESERARQLEERSRKEQSSGLPGSISDAMTAVGHRIASVTPLIGPAAAQVGEQAGRGDIGGAGGQLGGMYLGGELAAHPVEAAKFVGKVGDKALRGTPWTETGRLEAAQKQALAVKKPSMTETEYAQQVTDALPDLQRIAQENPGKIKTPRAAVGAINNRISQIEAPISNHLENVPAAQQIVPVQNFRPRIEQAIDQAFAKRPGEYTDVAEKAKQDVLDFVGDQDTSIHQLEGNRRALNEDAKYDAAMPDNRAARAARLAARAAADAVRDINYGDGNNPGELERVGIQATDTQGRPVQIRDVRQQVGRLINVRDHFEDAITRAEATGDWSAFKVMKTGPSLAAGGLGALVAGHATGLFGGVLGLLGGEGLKVWNDYLRSKNPNLNTQKMFRNLANTRTPVTSDVTATMPPAPVPPVPFQHQVGAAAPPPAVAPQFRVQPTGTVSSLGQLGTRGRGGVSVAGLLPERIGQEATEPPPVAPQFRTEPVGEARNPNLLGARGLGGVVAPRVAGLLPERIGQEVPEPTPAPAMQGKFALEPTGTVEDATRLGQRGLGGIVAPRVKGLLPEAKSTRWYRDKGSMPGEPMEYLDIPENGDHKEAKAVIVEHETPKGSKFEALTQDGKSLGTFDHPQQAREAAERQFPGGEGLPEKIGGEGREGILERIGKEAKKLVTGEEGSIGKPDWWNEPSENRFAQGKTKGEVIMDWLERHGVPQENGKYVFYHATPVEGGATDTLRAGSLLAEDEATAHHQASREWGARAGPIKVAKVLVNPEDLGPTGIWAHLRNDTPVENWSAAKPAFQFEGSKKKGESTLGKISEEQVPYTRPMPLPAGKISPVEGTTTKSVLHHELGHAVVAGLNGIQTDGIMTHRYPLMSSASALAALRIPSSQFYDSPGVFKKDVLVNGGEKLVDMFAAGAAANELIDGLHRDQNPGLWGDRRAAARLFNALDIPESQHRELFNAAIDRAKTKLSGNGITDLIKSEAGFREDNLPVEFHFSQKRLARIMQEVRRLQNEPATAEVGHETADFSGRGEGGGETVAGREGAGAEEPRKAPAPWEIKPFKPPKRSYDIELEGSRSGSTTESRTITLDALNRKKAFEEAQKKYPDAMSYRMTAERMPEVGPPFEMEPKEEDLYTAEGAKGLAEKIGAKVVGSVAKGKAKPGDLDLRIDGKYDNDAVEKHLGDIGFEHYGSQLVGPKEAKTSKKVYAPGWNRAEYFEDPKGRKVEVWHDANEELVSFAKEAPKYPKNEEGFEHIDPKILEHLTPDEKEFVKGNKRSQQTIEESFKGIKPTVKETKAAIQAGGALGGWWQRFIDTFKALGEPTEAAKIQKLGPEHAEALKAWHSAVSGNKAVDHANRVAWGTYADWLDAGRPKDRATINEIVAANGKPRGNAAISDTIKNGKVVNQGLDTTKLYNLINSPQMRDVSPEPFHGNVFDPNKPSPVAGVSPGARKIPSMAATVAGEGNLNRLVLDAHMLDFYGENGWTDNTYIAHSAHLRAMGKELGLTGGEAQEQIWGTVLGIKKLLREGVSPSRVPKELTHDVVNSIGKDYADIIKDDPALISLFKQIKKHGIDPGGERAQQRLRDITSGKQPASQEVAHKGLLANVAKRIQGQLKNVPTEPAKGGAGAATQAGKRLAAK